MNTLCSVLGLGSDLENQPLYSILTDACADPWRVSRPAAGGSALHSKIRKASYARPLTQRLYSGHS
eukprot:scaffold110344_cov20-Prasinocladus_malaysianus.AAC.1